MAGTTIQGPGGSFTSFTGVNSKFAAWSANFVIETVDTTGFEDVGNHTNEPTAVYVTGAAIGTGQSGNAGPIPQGAMGATPDVTTLKGTLVLIAQSGRQLSFTGVLTSVSLNRVFNGKLDTLHSFISSGAITPTWT